MNKVFSYSYAHRLIHIMEIYTKPKLRETASAEWKLREKILDGSAFPLVFLQAKHSGAAVRNCYGIPTG